MNRSMFRSEWALSAALVFSLATACSDDDSGDGGESGSAGSSSGNGGSGGSQAGGDAGSAGTSMSSAGSGGDEETYTAEEACQRFAEVTCDKGEECGVVVTSPLCLECNALFVAAIANQCEMTLGGPRNRADVDRCIDGIADRTCEETCSNAPFEGCEAFDELPSGGLSGVICDPQTCL